MAMTLLMQHDTYLLFGDDLGQVHPLRVCLKHGEDKIKVTIRAIEGDPAHNPLKVHMVDGITTASILDVTVNPETHMIRGTAVRSIPIDNIFIWNEAGLACRVGYDPISHFWYVNRAVNPGDIANSQRRSHFG